MKHSIEKYRKKSLKETSTVVTTINITRDQKDFIDSQGLNASELIRDLLNDFILKNKSKVS